jgi:hypothetical protein
MTQFFVVVSTKIRQLPFVLLYQYVGSELRKLVRNFSSISFNADRLPKKLFTPELNSSRPKAQLWTGIAFSI